MLSFTSKTVIQATFVTFCCIWCLPTRNCLATRKVGKALNFCNPDCGRGLTSSSSSNLATCNCVFYQYKNGKLQKKNLIKSSCSLVTNKKDPCYKICKSHGGLKGSLCIDRCFCVPKSSDTANTGIILF